MLEKYIPGTYTIPELVLGKKMVLRDINIEVFSDRSFPRDKLIVGFMGSAGKEPDMNGYVFEPTPELKVRGEMLGKIVAEEDGIASNGAVWGAPYYPIRGAHESGGFTMGVSPFPDEKSHVKSNPIKHLDLLIYLGIGCFINPRADFTFRDWCNSIFPDVFFSEDGRWGTANEVTQYIEIGGIYVPAKGSGGATDMIVDAYESKKIVKDTGAIFVIQDDLEDGLEYKLRKAMALAKERWKKEGRAQNRFSYVADELEKVMFAK